MPQDSRTGFGLAETFDKDNAATFGLREDGTPKGYGYFGMLPYSGADRPPGTFSTELSYDSEVDGKRLFYPILVPTLTREEIDHILSGAEPTDAMYNKAIEHALTRMQSNKSPFAEPHERYPLPEYKKAR
jgi:hypothetical protein